MENSDHRPVTRPDAVSAHGGTTPASEPEGAAPPGLRSEAGATRERGASGAPGGERGDTVANQASRAREQALPGAVAELVGELSETTAPSRRRRLTAAISRLAGRGGRAGRHSVLSGGHWLTSQVLAMAPRLPVRDQQTLRAQFPGLNSEELADALILGAARAASAVGAAAGMAMVLPLPAAPVEVAVETLALVGIEIKLVAELHEVYGMRASGPAPERMLAYVAAWAHRRGVALGPAGVVLVVGSPLRKRLQRRLIARAGRSAMSLGPLFSGAAAGALLNRYETRRLGTDVRDDLRRRSPHVIG